MNADQIALFDKAGELARLFHEKKSKILQEPGPDRPWFFHPLGWCIDIGYTGVLPEYDRPTAEVDPRTATFAQRVGSLSHTTQIWEDSRTMVESLPNKKKRSGIFSNDEGYC